MKCYIWTYIWTPSLPLSLSPHTYVDIYIYTYIVQNIKQSSLKPGYLSEVLVGTKNGAKREKQLDNLQVDINNFIIIVGYT